MIKRALLVAVVLLAPVFLAGCASRYTAPPVAPPEYVGELRDGKANGQGTLTWASGDALAKYVGEFRNGKMHGQGTLTYADGSKYVGEFKDGAYNGQGTLTFVDGHKYVGELMNASKHVGGYRGGKLHGKGTITYADGRAEESIWKDGVFQSLTAKGRKQRQAYEEKLLQEQLAAELLKQQQRQKQAMQIRLETCKEFGFKEGSESFAQCMFDLFKLEQEAIQSQATSNTASERAATSAASQNALLAQQQRQIDEQLRL